MPFLDQEGNEIFKYKNTEVLKLHNTWIWQFLQISGIYTIRLHYLVSFV